MQLGQAGPQGTSKLHEEAAQMPGSHGLHCPTLLLFLCLCLSFQRAFSIIN